VLDVVGHHRQGPAAQIDPAGGVAQRGELGRLRLRQARHYLGLWGGGLGVQDRDMSRDTTRSAHTQDFTAGSLERLTIAGLRPKPDRYGPSERTYLACGFGLAFAQVTPPAEAWRAIRVRHQLAPGMCGAGHPVPPRWPPPLRWPSPPRQPHTSPASPMRAAKIRLCARFS
jgi:hypothetical protein